MNYSRRVLVAALCAALTAPFTVAAQITVAAQTAPARRPATAVKKTTPTPPASPTAPKLVVLIVGDQFRADYLTRWAAQYDSGLARLLKSGAVFTGAHQDHFPTVTAVGHSVTMTGAIPAQSGIIANEWYDRASGAVVTSVSDNNEQLLGDAGKASSPRRLLVSTVGDQLKMSGRKGAKVVGISMKDRAAILPAGHMANGAYWFSHTSGNFVSSTYYFTQLPAWVDAFNARKLPATYAGKAWMTLDTQKPFSLIQGDTPLTLNEGIYSSPFGNELLESFAEAALDGEKLGQSGSTDILTVSFSSIDAVGHAKGPDSLEMRDLCLRFDKTLGTLFDAIDKRVGLANSLIVFTSDHGVVPVPEVNQARRMPGGRLGKSVRDTLDAALTARYGAGKWIAAGLSELIYLDRNLIESRKLRLDEVQDFAAKTLMSVPHIERVFTSEDLRHGRIAPDPIAQRVAKGFHERRGADLYLVFESFWLDGSGTSGTSHGQPYNYDSHVPLVFLSPLVKPGAYHGRAAVYDIAPTLSAILGIEPPSAAFGRVLDEMLVQR